jgi:cell division protein YceG involved in septum cleavage
VLKWIGALLLLTIVLGAVGVWQMRRAREHRRKWEQIVMPETIARVPADWSAQTLAQRLKKSGKVRDAEAFLEAAQQVGLKRVTEGGYALPAKAGPLDLAKVFVAPPTLVNVTFPEGWTAAKMGQRLKSNDFREPTNSGVWRIRPIPQFLRGKAASSPILICCRSRARANSYYRA